MMLIVHLYAFANNILLVFNVHICEKKGGGSGHLKIIFRNLYFTWFNTLSIAYSSTMSISIQKSSIYFSGGPKIISVSIIWKCWFFSLPQFFKTFLLGRKVPLEMSTKIVEIFRRKWKERKEKHSKWIMWYLFFLW